MLDGLAAPLGREPENLLVGFSGEYPDALVAQTSTAGGDTYHEAVENGKIVLRTDTKVPVTFQPTSDGAAPGCATTLVQHQALLVGSDGTSPSRM